MRKKKAFHQLTLQERVDIVHDVFVEKESRDEIAVKYCVSKQFIIRLVHKLKTNKKYL